MRFNNQLCFIGLSLFGGLSFASAPVSSVNVTSNLAQAQTAQSQPVATSNPAQAQPVVNASALLATLSPAQRITRLENQVQYLSGLNSQLQNLSNEVDQLRGQNEKFSFQLQTLKKRIDTLNAAPPTTDATSSTVPTTVPAASAAVNSSATTTPPATLAQPGAKEQAAFTQAYNQLLKQQYAVATTNFNAFLTNYPNSTLLADAHYWLGDLYLAQGQPDNASQQYRAVVNIQNASKRPDAMVKLGTILLAYGDSAHAKQLFMQVMQQYPKTTAATQSQTRLKSL